MFRQKIILDVKGADDRIHSYSCDPSSPLGEIHDALVTMKAYVIEKIKEQSEPKSEEIEEKEQTQDSIDG